MRSGVGRGQCIEHYGAGEAYLSLLEALGGLARRTEGRSVDKWVLKDIASHYLPRSIVYRKKTGFPLPLADYLAPLPQEKFSHGGFCVDFLGM